MRRRTFALLLCFGLLVAGLGLTGVAARSLVIAVPDEPPVLDPTTNASASIDQILNHNVYEGLLSVKPDGTLEPALAESYEVSTDGLTYTFHLRHGVVFHDGHPFTAADVKATFERDKDPKIPHPHPEYYTEIASIDTPDPYTVVFHMTQVDAEFLSLLALGDSIIQPADLPSDIAQHPDGTGPFQFAAWQHGDHITLERFDDYYRPGVPSLGEVIFRFIPDPASQLAALLAGDVDMIARVPAEIALSVKDHPGYTIQDGPQNLLQILAINNARAPFSKLKVRQAIAYALDRNALIQGSMFGLGAPTASPLTPTSPYYLNLTGLYPYDPAKARELLKEAGYPNGFSATITLPQNYEIHVRTGQIIADELSRVGIKLSIKLVDWGQWLDQVYTQADYDLTVIGHVGKLDPGAMLASYGPGSKDYYFRRGYDDPALDKLLEEGRTTLDEAKRKTIYDQAQTIIAKDVVNYFIQDPYQIFVMKKGITGLELYPIYVIDVTGVSWSSSS